MTCNEGEEEAGEEDDNELTTWLHEKVVQVRDMEEEWGEEYMCIYVHGVQLRRSI